MTTPHFALAQHPETGEWCVMQWKHSTCHWQTISYSHWQPSRMAALQSLRDIAQAAVERIPIESRHIWPSMMDSLCARVATLDRLIAIENANPGDAAHVQTIAEIGE